MRIRVDDWLSDDEDVKESENIREKKKDKDKTAMLSTKSGGGYKGYKDGVYPTLSQMLRPSHKIQAAKKHDDEIPKRIFIRSSNNSPLDSAIINLGKEYMKKREPCRLSLETIRKNIRETSIQHSEVPVDTSENDSSAKETVSIPESGTELHNSSSVEQISIFPRSVEQTMTSQDGGSTLRYMSVLYQMAAALSLNQSNEICDRLQLVRQEEMFPHMEFTSQNIGMPHLVFQTGGESFGSFQHGIYIPTSYTEPVNTGLGYDFPSGFNPPSTILVPVATAPEIFCFAPDLAPTYGNSFTFGHSELPSSGLSATYDSTVPILPQQNLKREHNATVTNAPTPAPLSVNSPSVLTTTSHSTERTFLKGRRRLSKP